MRVMKFPDSRRKILHTVTNELFVNITGGGFFQVDAANYPHLCRLEFVRLELSALVGLTQVELNVNIKDMGGAIRQISLGLAQGATWAGTKTFLFSRRDSLIDPSVEDQYVQAYFPDGLIAIASISAFFTVASGRLDRSLITFSQM